MHIEYSYFASLIEMRFLLEIESAKLAALRRTDQDILDIKKALDTYADKVNLGEQAVEEDLLFHLKIADASKNAVFKSLMLIITPEIIQYLLQLDIYKNVHATPALDEHEIILKHIVAQESEEAAAAMQKHLKAIFDYSQRLKNRQGNGTNGIH